MIDSPLSCYQSPTFQLKGTGGELTENNIFDYFYTMPVPYVELSPQVSDIPLGPIESLIYIREALEVSLTDLAKMFNVTRPTIYAWLNGKEPSRKDFKKIQYFSGIAKEVKRLKITRVDALIHRPIFNNKSFFDLIINTRSSEHWKTPLETLKKISDKEDERRKEKKGSSKEIRSASDVNDDYSTPIF